MRPRRPVDVGARPLNFTVRAHDACSAALGAHSASFRSGGSDDAFSRSFAAHRKSHSPWRPDVPPVEEAFMLLGLDDGDGPGNWHVRSGLGLRDVFAAALRLSTAGAVASFEVRSNHRLERAVTRL